jgi:hypothetical protein
MYTPVASPMYELLIAQVPGVSPFAPLLYINVFDPGEPVAP